MKAVTALLAVVFGLAGCAQPERLYDDGAGAPLAPSGQVWLNRELEIPPDRTRVFMQRGEVIAMGDLDHYHPSCDLEVRNLLPETQRVARDTFSITRVVYSQEPVVALEAVRLAGLRWGGGLLWEGGHSIYRFVRMDLHSEQQPDVLRLTCRGAYEDYHRASYPTPMEIRVALGEIITLR